MRSIIFNWQEKYVGQDKSRTILSIVIVGLIIMVIGIAGTLYYFSYTEKKQLEENKRRQQAQIQQKTRSIIDFYSTSLSGASPRQFMQFMLEVYSSRQSIELLGFTERSYLCNSNTCNFSYELNDNTIFNIQNKVFMGKEYQPSFSENKLDFLDIPSGLNINPGLNAFHQKSPIAAPGCNDILNYLYGYNSLVPKDERFSIVTLPSSTVTSAEADLPNLPESYQLLFATWSVSIPDTYLDVVAFWERHAFLDSIIIKSVEKNNNSSIKSLNVKGAFLCKK